MTPSFNGAIRFAEFLTRPLSEARASTLIIWALGALVVIALNWAPFPDWLTLIMRILAFFAVTTLIACTLRLCSIAAHYQLDVRRKRSEQAAIHARRMEEATCVADSICERLDQMNAREREELAHLVALTKQGKAYTTDLAFNVGGPDIGRCLWDLCHSGFVRDVSPPGHLGPIPFYMANQVLIDYVEQRSVSD